jgi:hypothetical protein
VGTYLHNQRCAIALITTLIICLGASLSTLTWSNQTATYAQTSTAPNFIPLIEWNVTFGLSYYNKACEIIQTHDGGYAVTGTCGPVEGPPNVALVKLDSVGKPLWNQTYDMRFINYPLTTALVQTDDDGFTIVGNDNKGMALIKTDSEGTVQWKRTYLGYNDIAQGMTQTSDGGYIIAGETAFDMKTHPSTLLIKTDSSGDIQWRRTYGTGAKYFRAVVQADNESYVAAGTTFSIETQQFSAWLVKVDTAGNILWEKKFPATPTSDSQYTHGDNDIFTLIKTNDEGYALAGRTSYGNTTGTGTTAALLIKTDATGSIQWNKTYGVSYRETELTTVYSMVQTSDNGYALTGSAFNDMVLFKIDTNGNKQWNQTFQDNQNTDTAYSVIETVDCGFALAGKTNIRTLDKGENFYILKTTPILPATSQSSTSSTETLATPIEILAIGASIAVVSCVALLLYKKKRTATRIE